MTSPKTRRGKMVDEAEKYVAACRIERENASPLSENYSGDLAAAQAANNKLCEAEMMAEGLLDFRSLPGARIRNALNSGKAISS